MKNKKKKCQDKKNNNTLFFKLLLIIIEALLFILVIFRFKNNQYLSFASLGVALFFTMLFWGKENGRIYMPKLILLFDVIADLFITLNVGVAKFGDEGNKMIGMIAFILAQLFTSIYVTYGENRKCKWRKFVSTLIVFVALFIPLLILKLSDLKLLYIEALVYFAFLLTSLVFSVIKIKKNPLLPLSLLCLTMCDLIIGLGFIENMFDLSSSSFFAFLNHFSVNLPWFFYIPSFTILALTIRKNYKFIKKDNDKDSDNDDKDIPEIGDLDPIEEL